LTHAATGFHDGTGLRRVARVRGWRAVLFVLVGLGCALPTAGEVAVPVFARYVTDLTGTLRADEAAALERRLVDFADARGTQVAVLVVPSTDGEAIEAYALRVVETWRLGRKGVDDGVLLVVALDDRRVRIEVGYGLEGALPDATSKRIIDETIVPQFRAGNVYAGLNAGVERILAVVSGEALPPPTRGPAAADPWTTALFLAVFCAALLRGGQGRRPLRGTVAGLASGGLTYVFTSVALAAGASAFAAFLLTVLVGGAMPGGWVSHRRYGAGPGGLGGGWSPGGFGGGGFGGGGGGSFGGGGASGRW
jgi:uncharacterized protein